MPTPQGQLDVVAKAILGIVELAAALDRTGRPLLADKIREIRRLRAEGLSLREIERRVGVCASGADALAAIASAAPGRTSVHLIRGEPMAQPYEPAQGGSGPKVPAVPAAQLPKMLGAS